MSTIQYSLTRHQFCMITSSLLQSLRIAYNFIVFHIMSESSTEFPFNSCLSVIDCREIVLNCRVKTVDKAIKYSKTLFNSFAVELLCEFEDFALTSDVIKRIFTNLKNFVKFAIFFYEF